MTTPTLHRHDDSEALAQALAQRIADDLARAIRARGKAVLAVSGGRTPRRLFEVLGERPLDWAKVTVTLVDERWVPPQDERSNARLVREHLLRREAAAAVFVPLYASEPTPEAALPNIGARIEMLPLPLDVAVLGMGEDGHTASFFPGGDRLAEALDPDSGQVVLPMRAEGAGEPRITLTLPVLAAARALYLHIEGEGKRETYDAACAEGAHYPVSAMMAAAPQLQTYWCP